MLKLLIVDDEAPARKELRYLIESSDEKVQVWEAKNGKEALETVNGIRIDMAFIDINLGDLDGIFLARELLQINKELKVVFATAYDDYAIEAFELNALDYILKPFESRRIQMALARIYDQREASQQSVFNKINRIAKRIRKLSLWDGDRVVLVEIDEIVYISTSDRNCRICTLNGQYLSNQSLSYFEEKFKNDKFMRVNRSYLVNLEHITEIVPWFNHAYLLKMRNYEKEEVIISRKKIKDFRQLFDF